MLAAEVDPSVVKGFHRQFVTGVTAVATMHDGRPYGLAVNAFSSLSLDPPMVIVCVQKTSSTYGYLFANDFIGVSVLAADQAGVAGTLASKAADKFEQIRWAAGPFGSPLISSAAAWIEVEIEERIQASTHTMFVGRVVAAGHTERPPLLYAGGRFYDGGCLVDA